MRKIAIIGLFLLPFLFEGVLVASQSKNAPYFEWTMVNVCDDMQQADAHLIRFADGYTVLIDAGFSGRLLVPFLERKRITQIDLVVISHAHKDHYGGLVSLFKGGIHVEEVRFNLPPREICNMESPWGCDLPHIHSVLADLARQGVRVNPITQGEMLYQAPDGAKLEVLYAYDGLKTPIGKSDINDMSAIVLLSAGKTRALFTGDLNRPMGAHLAEVSKILRADILKVPHHGTESLVPNEFFDRVNAKVALVPSPGKLWESSRSERARTYFKKANIPVLVSGIDGAVVVTADSNGFQVTTESGKTIKGKAN